MEKSGLIVLVVAAGLFFATACGNKGSVASNAPEQTASVIEMSIGGMTCTGCEQTIQKNIGKIEGVKSVKATYTDGKALIEYYSGKADTSVMKAAVNEAGYTFLKFNPVKQ